MTEPAFRASRKVLGMPVCLDSVNVVTDKSFSRRTCNKEVQSTGNMRSSQSIGVLVFTSVVIFFLILCARDSACKVSANKRPWRLHRGSPQAHEFVLRLPQRPWSALQTSDGAYNNDRLRSRKLRHQLHEEEEEETALEGMGTLYRRGKRSMTELLVVHLSENTTPHDLRLFLRTLHRSGMTARADVVLLFLWRPLPKAMVDVIHEEEQSFHKLLQSYRPKAQLAYQSSKLSDGTAGPSLIDSRLDDHVGSTPVQDIIKTAFPVSSANISIFNAAAFWKASQEPPSRGPSIWGNTASSRFGRSSSSSRSAPERRSALEDQLQELPDGYNRSVVYGAIVGFDLQELDPADAMRAFINELPVELRRWMCYQILLGMVRQKYRHVMLSEVKGVIVLEDLLAPLKKKDTGLYVFAQDRRWSDIAVVMQEIRRPSSPRPAAEAGKRPPQEQVEHLESEHAAGGWQGSLIENVYGKEVWDSLEKEEKRTRRMLSSGVITGGIRSVRTLASAMATEIVRVALLRKSRHPFKDEAILSYLIHKSSVLGRKVTSHLHVQLQQQQQNTATRLHLSSSSSSSSSALVNLLSGSSNLAAAAAAATTNSFFTQNGVRYAVILGYHDEAVSQERRNYLLTSLHNDICFSSVSDSQVYTDCAAHQTGEEKEEDG